MKYSQDQPPKILKSLNILKPNIQKYWSIEIFSSPTSKNIEVLKYFQAQPPGPAKAKTLLQTEINIVLVSGKYFNCHCRGLYEIFWISLYLFFRICLTGPYDFVCPKWAGGPGSALFHLDLCWWLGAIVWKNLFYEKVS